MKTNESEIIKELEQQFGAEPEHYVPDEEEDLFMKERHELEEKVHWSFEQFEKYFDELKIYGLDEKLINKLEWFIVFKLENQKEKFLRSLFYERFKDHDSVKRAISEYERRKEI